MPEHTMTEAARLRAEAQRKLEKAEILETGGLDTLTVYLPKKIKDALRAEARRLRLTMTDITVRALADRLGCE